MQRAATMGHAPEESKPFMQRLLDGIERVGNKVPHPVVIFVALIALVILLSHIFYLMGTSVTYEGINEKT
ncbi:AbgT family transporter, partial [Pedosphaera parvula]